MTFGYNRKNNLDTIAYYTRQLDNTTYTIIRDIPGKFKLNKITQNSEGTSIDIDFLIIRPSGTTTISNINTIGEVSNEVDVDFYPGDILQTSVVSESGVTDVSWNFEIERAVSTTNYRKNNLETMTFQGDFQITASSNGYISVSAPHDGLIKKTTFSSPSGAGEDVFFQINGVNIGTTPNTTGAGVTEVNHFTQNRFTTGDVLSFIPSITTADPIAEIIYERLR